MPEFATPISIPWALAAALIGYLSGSLSFARLIGRISMPDEDVEHIEFDIPNSDEKYVMTSVSATTISTRKGPRLGCLTSILDMTKAAVPLLVFQSQFPDQPHFLIAAGFAVVGHNWPVFHRFKGGRGLSPVIGGMLFIDWLGVILTNLIGMGIGLGIFRDLLLAYSGGLILLIPWLWFRFESGWYLAYAVLVNLAFWVAMRPELKQYIPVRRSGAIGNLSEYMGELDMGKGLEAIRDRFRKNT
jgi:glycerol-3-phosphate acyltransferase PlsY